MTSELPTPPPPCRAVAEPDPDVVAPVGGIDAVTIPEAPLSGVVSDTRRIQIFVNTDPLDTQLNNETLIRAEQWITRYRDCDAWIEFSDTPDDAIPAFGADFDWQGRVAIQRSTSSLESAWVVGDVHADLPGLACALAFIDEQTRHERRAGPPLVVLLGDLIDDNEENAEVLALVSHLMGDGEMRIVTLRGNHDISLRYDNEGDQFSSSVDPCEFQEQLAAGPPAIDDGSRFRGVRTRDMAISFIRHLEHAPSAMFLRDGTILSHGGVPHVDLHEGMKSVADLGSPAAASDYAWMRLEPNIKRRMAIPQASTKNREMGSLDFEAFRRIGSDLLGFQLERIVRGHDHVAARFDVLGGPWEDRVLTLNNMSWRLGRELGPSVATPPCIAEWRAFEPLRVHRLAIDPTWHDRMRCPLRDLRT